MADLWIQVLPRDAGDLERLVRDFRPKWAAEDAIGYESRIELEPDSLTLHQDVAMLYLELGRPLDAARHFATSLGLKPGAAAHFNLGTALWSAGQTGDAIQEYREALRLDPGFAPAHNNLGNALADQGRFDDALEHYREVTRLDPTHAAARNNVGFILMARGDLDEASRDLVAALRLDPRLPDAHFNLGLISERRGELDEAVRHFRDALRIRPDWSRALVELAWILATTSDSRLSDPRQAVALAEQAARLINGADRRMMDVLAAAYASDRQFDRAVEAIQRAVDSSGATPATDDLLRRQELYKQHLPYREPPGR